MRTWVLFSWDKKTNSSLLIRKCPPLDVVVVEWTHIFALVKIYQSCMHISYKMTTFYNCKKVCFCCCWAFWKPCALLILLMASRVCHWLHKTSCYRYHMTSLRRIVTAKSMELRGFGSTPMTSPLNKAVQPGHAQRQEFLYALISSPPLYI